MAQLYSFSSLGIPPAAAGIQRPRPVDPELRNLRRIDEPEAPLAIEFVGLSREQQLAALASFPGGKRFYLAGHNPQN